MGNSNSSMRDRLRSYYRPLEVQAKQLATAREDPSAAVETQLNILQASKTNMEGEYIKFLKEYAPYSNVVLKVDGQDLAFNNLTPFVKYPAILQYT